MKTTLKLGTAVFVAALFLLHPLAACAAMWQPAEAVRHHCCPRTSGPTNTTPAADCCIASAPPSTAVQVQTDQSAVWGAVPNPVVPVGTPVHAAAVAYSEKLFLTPHLFVKFHQLLI